MTCLRCIFLLPALAFCGSYSGSITLLDGTPVVGAVVKVGSDSVICSKSGFVLSGTLDAARRGRDPGMQSVRWTLDKGRLKASFAGRDLAGRTGSAETSIGVSGADGESSKPLATARSAASPDTLRVYWKGKRLVDLPVSGDTSVSLRIDTAWSDDAGIPWNPRIPYASLRDSRDGRTYRTVRIGALTWMAENLNFAVTNSHWFVGIDSSDRGAVGEYPFLDDSVSRGAKYGRYYPWTAAMSLPDSCDSVSCLPNPRGVCPLGWHVPSSEEWRVFSPLGWNTAEDSVIGQAMKSVFGWGSLISQFGLDQGSSNGSDLFGFRALNAGGRLQDGRLRQGKACGWWANSELPNFPVNAWYVGWIDPWRLGDWEGGKRRAYPIRCIQD